MGVCYRKVDGRHRRFHDREDHDWPGEQPMDAWDATALFVVAGAVSAMVAHAVAVATRSVGSFA